MLNSLIVKGVVGTVMCDEANIVEAGCLLALFWNDETYLLLCR